MRVMLPPEERKALKELLDGPHEIRRWLDSARPIPSETIFMLMLVHLKARVDALEEKQRTSDSS